MCLIQILWIQAPNLKHFWVTQSFQFRAYLPDTSPWNQAQISSISIWYKVPIFKLLISSISAMYKVSIFKPQNIKHNCLIKSLQIQALNFKHICMIESLWIQAQVWSIGVIQSLPFQAYLPDTSPKIQTTNFKRFWVIQSL